MCICLLAAEATWMGTWWKEHACVFNFGLCAQLIVDA